MTSGTCPQCGHDERGRSSEMVVRVQRALRLPVKPARCPVETFDESGWGSVPCECRDAFHGS